MEWDPPTGAGSPGLSLEGVTRASPWAYLHELGVRAWWYLCNWESRDSPSAFSALREFTWWYLLDSWRRTHNTYATGSSDRPPRRYCSVRALSTSTPGELVVRMRLGAPRPPPQHSCFPLLSELMVRLLALGSWRWFNTSRGLRWPWKAEACAVHAQLFALISLQPTGAHVSN